MKIIKRAAEGMFSSKVANRQLVVGTALMTLPAAAYRFFPILDWVRGIHIGWKIVIFILLLVALEKWLSKTLLRHLLSPDRKE